MSEVTVRFVGGPAHDLVRALPAEPDGSPPTHWILRHPDDARPPAGGGPDHLYQREHPVGGGTWTMCFVHTYPVGMTE
ncbi:hypothetical protein OG777_26005 [Micromonospora peucetia]|uniref:Uncharacterized protein n=1 Tax=Micromonospora peucetia TaxID=47871 RepID=A0A1C6W3X4_9ACTN|nr:hypothetical protein [Micromonospora peucetia]MCX4390352.1 hypothetical protein [Micromonospora peucetia]SCL73207.1 hypothetical protein GA0070608_5456 [Micromonospora peucetia]